MRTFNVFVTFIKINQGSTNKKKIGELLDARTSTKFECMKQIVFIKKKSTIVCPLSPMYERFDVVVVARIN